MCVGGGGGVYRNAVNAESEEDADANHLGAEATQFTCCTSTIYWYKSTKTGAKVEIDSGANHLVAEATQITSFTGTKSTNTKKSTNRYIYIYIYTYIHTYIHT